MEKQFIPYEQALELKELGFEEECFAFYGLSRYDLNNNFIAEYSSALEASKKTLTRCSCIVQCINPKYNRTTANNFIWKRKEIYG